ncbi:MAG: hypothetical protein ACR2IE_06260 [Candidatus Sumerlaeaceae bacterium]
MAEPLNTSVRAEISFTRVLVTVLAVCVPIVLASYASYYQLWDKLTRGGLFLFFLLPLAITALAALTSVLLPIGIWYSRDKSYPRRLRIVSNWALPLAQLGLGFAGLLAAFGLFLPKFIDIWRQIASQSGFFSIESLPVAAWFLMALLLPAGSLRLVWTGLLQARHLWPAIEAPQEDPLRLAVQNLRRIGSVALAITLPVALLYLCSAVARITAFWSIHLLFPSLMPQDGFLISNFSAPLLALALLFSPIYHFATALGWRNSADTVGAVPFRLTKAGIITTAALALVALGGMIMHNWIVREKLITGEWRLPAPARPQGEPYRMYEIEHPANAHPRLKWTPPTPDGRILMTETTRGGLRLWAVDIQTSHARLLTSGSGGIIHPIIEGDTTPAVREESNLWLTYAHVTLALFPRYPDLPPRRIDTVTGRAVRY